LKTEQQAQQQLEFSKHGKLPKKAHVDALIIDEHATIKVSAEEAIHKEIKTKKEESTSEAVEHLKNIDKKFEEGK
jgi:hypothetical protein